MPEFQDNAIFWLEVEKIKPNPHQPRREFDEARLRDLADSIRQYGILQPLVVTRQEIERPEGGLVVEYELIAGERRLRGAKLAGLSRVPAVIKAGEESDKEKLEMAIIENLQREDLNPLERAQAFHRLSHEFGLTHEAIGHKVSRSRVFVTNTIRLLGLPKEIMDALTARQISEGHTRPILMLADRPEEQMTLFKEILYKRINVREAEAISRRIAYDRVRKKEYMLDPAIAEMEEKLTEKLGTRVRIERKETGGKVVIDFFSQGDLEKLAARLAEVALAAMAEAATAAEEADLTIAATAAAETPVADQAPESPGPDRPDDDLYFVKNFSV